MSNSMMIINPYWYSGTWVFDDPAAELVREPFVSGADDIVSKLVEQQDIPDAREGFKLLFSANPFPGSQAKGTWLREEVPGDPQGGNWYSTEIAGRTMEGWLCPALFKYFDQAPAEIHFKAEPLNR